jgi:dolichol-phosphate mannosyltransferase
LTESVRIVVMAFNEAENLPHVLDDIHAAFDAAPLSALTLEVVVVDDGSQDGTAAVAERRALAWPALRVHRHAQNQGLGGVYRTGLGLGGTTWVTFMPADGQYPVVNVARLLAAREGTDLVLGFLPETRESAVGQFLSWAERLLYRILLGPMPRFQGLFLVRSDVVTSIPLVSTGRGWAVVVEMILRVTRKGHKWASARMELRPRLSGSSKVQNVRTIWANLRQMLALARRLRAERVTSRT